MNETLTLKWGTLKSWKLEETGPALAALKKYFEAGPVSTFCALQCDNTAQKEALCETIDALDGEIWSDWTGKKLSKDDAKKYVWEYQS